ncbi:hypothetical protein [Amycolatopsis sp. lyj-112]|uniref:hypothetical protein n=1 Tax=Amycolatopsis sp. lyj-112 TaxID=2789288 RepID=UPI00397DECF3
MISQNRRDRTDLVVLVGHDGLVEWSSHRDRTAVVAMLRDIADNIEEGTLGVARDAHAEAIVGDRLFGRVVWAVARRRLLLAQAEVSAMSRQ